MIIENARYVQDVITNQNRSIKATVDGLDTSVPLDPGNRHYAEIMRQVDAGELTIADAD
jgi:hypothetical protein